MIRNIVLIAMVFMLLSACSKNEEAKDAESKIDPKSGISEMKTSDKSDGKSKIVKDDPQDKGNESKFQKPVFQLKNWNSDVKKPEVDDDGGNVVVEKINKDEGDDSSVDIKIPENCLAAKLTNKAEKIIWTPKWVYEGVGGVKLPGVTLSNDSSVLAIIETTGTDKGPNGSRLILLNTYNWQVLKVHDFEDNMITKLSLLPDGKRIALWSEKQTSIKKPNELILAGIEKGDIKYSVKEIKTSVTDIFAIGRNILVKPADENFIYVFDSSEISKPAKKIKSLNQEGVFAFSQDTNRVLLAGEKYIEIFDSSGMDLISKISFDAGYSPENAIFAGKNDYIAVSSYNKPGYFIKDGQKKEFCDIAGHVLSFNVDDKALIFEKYLNNEICVLEVPDLNERGSFAPSRIMPRTQGAAIFIAFLKENSRYALLDSYGTLAIYTKYLKTNKWKKKIIFSAKK